jgi:hypothetical protein
LYRDLLPLINSGRIDLLDHPKLISQLTGLERRVARGGKDSIDHPPNSHDDLANAVAGLAAINTKYGGFDSSFNFVDTDTDVPPRSNRSAEREAQAQWDAQRLLNHIRMNGVTV